MKNWKRKRKTERKMILKIEKFTENLVEREGEKPTQVPTQNILPEKAFSLMTRGADNPKSDLLSILERRTKKEDRPFKEIKS